MARKFLVTVKTNKTTTDTTAATRDLLEVGATSTKIVRVNAIHCEQSNRAGDANAQQLELTVSRATTSGNTNSTVVTPRACSPGDTITATAEADNDVAASGGLTILVEGGMNNQAGWHWTPPPEHGIEIAPSNFLVLALATTPTASTDFEVTFECEEFG